MMERTARRLALLLAREAALVARLADLRAGGGRDRHRCRHGEGPHQEAVRRAGEAEEPGEERAEGRRAGGGERLGQQLQCDQEGGR